MQDNQTQQETSGSSKKPILLTAVVVIIVIIAVATFSSKPQSTRDVKSVQTTQTPVATRAPESASGSAQFKNGTYSAEGDYITHIGPKHIEVTVTLKNEIVTSADVKNEADDPMSVHYQNLFISGYKQYVIGRQITDIHLAHVSGSSLTPGGFNSALQSIEKQAANS